MTELNLKKLSRADLLEMLIDQGEELEAVKEKLAAAEAKLQDRELAINEAGSIAEASLKLNGVFDAAQSAAQQYLDNIAALNDRQETICSQMEQESREKADAMIAETTARCEEMLEKAKPESQAYWDEVSQRLEAFLAEHSGLRELLTVTLPKTDQG